MSACNKETNQDVSTGITISNVEPSYNSVTFDVQAQDANIIAYMCVTKGTAATSNEVFDNGTVVAQNSGNFTFKGLKSETEYTLCVVASNNQNLTKIESFDFSTLENSGAPATAKSAGIRLNGQTTDNVTFDITNGTDIDFSYVSIWSTSMLENYIMENSKLGYSDEATIKAMIEGYQYTAFKVYGAGAESKGLDYKTQYSESLFPDQDYMLITIGCTGNDDQYTMQDVTVVRFVTESTKLVGDLGVKIDCTPGYISMRYTITPNADATYYFYYATAQSQIDEYITYFDNKFGAGYGERMIKQFMTQTTLGWEDNTDVGEVPLTIGFDQSELMVSFIAVAADKNLMLGTLSRNDDHTKPIPESDPAKFSLEVDRVAASSAWFNWTFYDNCATIYARPLTPESYDSAMSAADQVTYSRNLFDEGWGFARPKNTQGQTVVYSEQYYSDIYPGNEYVVVATGLNYEAGLSVPLYVSDPFTLKTHTFENSEADTRINITGVTRTKAKAIYESTAKTSMLFHRILEDGSFYEGLTDQQIIDKLLSTSVDDGGEMWAVYDPSEQDAFKWEWTWTGLTPSTDYTYYYCSEDVDGRISELSKIPFHTSNADGGLNPDLTLTINSITTDRVTFDIVLNDDCSSSLYCLYSAEEVGEYNTQTELENRLKDFVISYGLRGTDSNYGIGLSISRPNKDYFLLAIGYGADNIEGPLHYYKFPATNGAVPYSSAARTLAASYRYRPQYSVFDRSSSAEVRNSNHQAKVIETPARPDKQVLSFRPVDQVALEREQQAAECGEGVRLLDLNKGAEIYNNHLKSVRENR